jgi:hydroxyacyl-ACP dehydratase HTD2-like protein with hotdog domain
MLKDQVGIRSSSHLVSLSDSRMKSFADAVKATVGNTSHSPITSTSIPTVFTIFRDGEFELLSKLGIALKEVLHANQEYHCYQPLLADEEIEFMTTLSSVVEKRGNGSSMAFMTFETEFMRKADSTKIAIARSTIVHRKALEKGEKDE